MDTWIVQAAAGLGIRLERLTPGDALSVTDEVKSKFVDGSPRVWWLGLKTPYAWYDSKSTRLSHVLPCHRGEVFFIPETDDEEPSPVFKIDARDIETLIGECTFFEYYVVSLEKEWLVAETEHDAFIVCNNSESSCCREAHSSIQDFHDFSPFLSDFGIAGKPFAIHRTLSSEPCHPEERSDEGSVVVLHHSASWCIVVGCGRCTSTATSHT
jgi:hypothetical protein